MAVLRRRPKKFSSEESFEDWRRYLITELQDIQKGTTVMLGLTHRISPQQFSNQKERICERYRHKMCLAIFNDVFQVPNNAPFMHVIEVVIQEEKRIISIDDIDVLGVVTEYSKMLARLNESFWRKEIRIEEFVSSQTD